MTISVTENSFNQIKSINQKFKTMEKFRITRHSCITTLDHYEHGELQEVNAHSIERHEEFDSLEQLLSSLNAHIGADYNADDFEITEEAIYTDVLCKFVNGFYFRASIEEIGLWRKGLIDLYNCHHIFYAEKVLKLKLTKEDEQESLFAILGNALNPNNQNAIKTEIVLDELYNASEYLDMINEDEQHITDMINAIDIARELIKTHCIADDKN